MIDHSKVKTRKDRILDAALNIFARAGFQNATITGISKEAGVSEATIYEYFGTKEDLLFAIPEKISDETFEKSSNVLPYIKSTEGRIRAIMLGYVQLYQDNPNYSALVLLHLMSNKRFRQTPAHAAIRRSAGRLLECIKEGIAEGTFKKDLNPYLIRSMLMGTIEHLFIHWHMQGMPVKETTIMDMLDPFLEIVLDGIRTGKEENSLTLHLRLEDAQVLGKLLQAKGQLKKERPEGARKARQAKNKLI
jgi:TetR/AcrR family transcriptional regulator, fatty acid metabolism regulator protein